jgi:soluble lytic murein transglycosylase-like protein
MARILYPERFGRAAVRADSAEELSLAVTTPRRPRARAARGDAYHVDAKLIRSVMRAESAFDPSAVSGADAQRLMQLMRQISIANGVSNPFDPRENIIAGTRPLRELLDQRSCSDLDRCPTVARHVPHGSQARAPR